MCVPSFAPIFFERHLFCLASYLGFLLEKSCCQTSHSRLLLEKSCCHTSHPRLFFLLLFFKEKRRKKNDLVAKPRTLFFSTDMFSKLRTLVFFRERSACQSSHLGFLGGGDRYDCQVSHPKFFLEKSCCQASRPRVFFLERSACQASHPNFYSRDLLVKLRTLALFFLRSRAVKLHT